MMLMTTPSQLVGPGEAVRETFSAVICVVVLCSNVLKSVLTVYFLLKSGADVVTTFKYVKTAVRAADVELRT